MAKSNLRLVPPITGNRTVAGAQPPRRPPNRELRELEHLKDAEVERLIEAARANRHGFRDALMILMAYRHGLRASEVTDVKWEQVDFDRSELHVNRLKGGTEATHPLTGRELRELRKHKRYSPPSSRFVFISERGAPLSAEGFNRATARLFFAETSLSGRFELAHFARLGNVTAFLRTEWTRKRAKRRRRPS